MLSASAPNRTLRNAALYQVAAASARDRRAIWRATGAAAEKYQPEAGCVGLPPCRFE